MSIDVRARTKKEIERRNQAITARAIEAKFDVIPNPEFKCRDVFFCDGLGELFNGNYYFKSVTHTIDKDGYKVSVEAQNVDEVMNAEVTYGVNDAFVSAYARKTYTVATGDCLSLIALRFGITWEKLYEANRDVLGDNPNNLYAGQQIIIPTEGGGSLTCLTPFMANTGQS